MGLFKDDMASGLQALGVPADDVEALTHASAVLRTVLGSVTRPVLADFCQSAQHSRSLSRKIH